MPPKRKPLTEVDSNTTASKKSKVDLPPIPSYIPLNPDYLVRSGESLLPTHTSPLDLFQYFFSMDIWDTLCTNTNLYQAFKSTSTQPPAKDITVGELQVWIGLIIYMGVLVLPSIKDYWGGTTRQDQMKSMSLQRFEYIKRYFHISATSSEPRVDNHLPEWYMKLEQVASSILTKFRKVY